ncbi:aldose 1-epimerase [Paenibacillus cremeus]|uniref:Aldose 1-epimerase n=1 Tax=Paenibacillus cremeus TaxID=2163881 RepID=A0A559KFP8_9BACL|nr:aldose 1-epimerase [Paenibacillus cremeus]TVY10955.1 aldose 1-epimerase [Paenibacillus cremeus]
MGRYGASLSTNEGFTTVVLTDSGSDAIAELIPEVGYNLFRFECGGRSLIQSPESLISLKQAPVCYQYGTPILFPPNRVKNGTFTFQGRTYQLPLNEPPDHHLHGEIASKPWEVIEFGVTEEQGAFVTSRFAFADHPEMLAYFPHRLSFTLTYRLFEGRLKLSGVIRNEGDDDAPFAYGFHPYFPLPFGDEEIVLTAPAACEWPVMSKSFVTGMPSVTDFSAQVSGKGASISNYPELKCTMLELQDDERGNRICRMALKNQGYTIAYQTDPIFSFALLFRPSWASAFSIEPYTCLTDAFNLPYEHEQTGVRGITAGEEIRFTNQLWME